jgi:tetratricopeptide (TPR) repeat protein
MKCPSCGAQAEGVFCSECGAPLKGAKCRECQAPLAAGARFCNNCGAATGSSKQRATPADSGNKLPWIFAGASLLVLVVVLALNMRGDDAPQADNRVPLNQMEGIGGAAAGGAPGPLTGSPREQADRLFNRVMTEKENGDTAQAKFFVPMAVQAYEMAGDLDADGYYHLSLLHNLGGNAQAAQQAAERVLTTSPNHLLALSAAAQAARTAGDNAAARRYYQRLIASYDAESKMTKQEYQDHGKMLPELKAEAESFLRQTSTR